MAVASKQELVKALASLEDAIEACKLSDPNSKQYKLARDGAIQRFEFCVELSWKVAAKFLGTAASSPKLVLREMLQNGLITDIQQWFDFIEARNKSSHTYDEEIAKEVYLALLRFPEPAKRLVASL